MGRAPRWKTSKTRHASWPPSRRRLERVAEEAIVDAYGESEQRTGLFTMIDEHLETPFETEVLGVKAVVERVDLANSDEIVTVCRGGGRGQRIPILDLQLPTPPPEGAEWIEAYRHWMKH